MRLVMYYDELYGDSGTVYRVQLDDGREVTLRKKHYTGEIQTETPPDPDIDLLEIYRFLKRNAHSHDFSIPVFERKWRISYRKVWDACYSFRQAYELAGKLWESIKDPGRVELFRIRCGNTVIRDWIC